MEIFSEEWQDIANGGIVFWVDETGQHRPVCSKNSLSSSKLWAGTNTSTMTRGDGIVAGKLNTAIITANQSE